METGDSSEYFPPPYPPGIRFLPKDVELIQYYLRVKLKGQKLPCDVIKEENVYAYNPEKLTKNYEDFEGSWYFFTPRNRKYAHGTRPSRSAGDGYWKATGSDKDIINAEGNKIGVKKSLTFYLGEQAGRTKTSWLMDEFRIDEFQQPIQPGTNKNMLLDTSVLCRIHYGRFGSKGATTSRDATNKNKGDNMIEDSLLAIAEADQPNDTRELDDAPAVAEVAAVELTNRDCQDQLNPSIIPVNSEAYQADAAIDNPLVLPQVTIAEPVNNIIQDQFNPSTLANCDDSPWNFFQSHVAPSLDIPNDFSFTDQNYGYLVDQCLPFHSEHLDFDCLWACWSGEVDGNATLQESSLDEANARVQQSDLGDSRMVAPERQSLGNSQMNTQEQQVSGNSVENTRAPAQRAIH